MGAQKTRIPDAKMKNAGTALKNYLATTQLLIWADLWTIQLVSGTTLYYNDSDINLTVGGNLFLCNSVLFDGAELDSEYGLSPNTTEVMCYPGPSTTVAGVPFLEACAFGQFDRANITKQRLFMPTWGDTSLGAITIFQGQITTIATTRNTVQFTCKDAKNLLNIYMPPRIYQPTCSFTFGDAKCGFDRSSIAVSSTVSAGSSLSVILATSLTQVAGYFNNGTVKFTSGANNGLSRSIKTYNPGYVQLVAPFPAQPAVGDAFTITPGCTKSFAGPTTSENASVFNGSTPQLIISNVAAPSGTYNGDNIVFTSGGNIGDTAIIQVWTSGEAIMLSPFPNSPAVGDTFNIRRANGKILTSGTITSPLTSSVIPTQLTNSDGFFNGGTLLFTSGVNVGQTQTISSWQDGTATVIGSFGAVPAVGDECVLTSVGTATQGTCSGYWGVDAPIHFGGERFIPVPETAY